MVHCCVPFCSSTRGRTTGISYHEIPVDENEKNKWLKVISREDFKPNFLSNTTVVCSLHFKTDDYISGLKLRRLKKHVVPSIFPGYPSYMKPKVTKERRTIVKHAVPFKLVKTLPVDDVVDESNGMFPYPVEISTAPVNEIISADESNGMFPYPVEISTAPVNEIISADESYEMLDCSTEILTVPSRSRQSIGIQANCADADKLKNMFRDKEKFRVKVWRLNNKLANIQAKLDSMKEQNQYYANNKYHQSLERILQGINEDPYNDLANILLEQIENFGKKKPCWDSNTIKKCVAWRFCSPKGYNFVRRENILKLPCKSTLASYVGKVSGETGVTSLIKERLKAEITSLSDAEKFCSLIIDEMYIKPQLIYDKKMDQFLGQKDTTVHVNKLKQEEGQASENSSKIILANSLLCFVINGLSTNYRIPAAFYFSRQLSGRDLFTLAKSVIKQVEEIGFRVIRIVTDNHKTNVTLMKHLGGGIMKPMVKHPFDNNRWLFLSFDPSHIIKNVRNQFMEKEMFDGEGIITGEYVKKLYEIQMGEKIKPVRFLTRKHVDPSNFEKMNVKRAIQIFSPEVISAIKFLKNNAGSHPKANFYMEAEATIKFMIYIHRWFTTHDVSNRKHYIQSRNDDKMHFFSVDDDRLQWLENDFLKYLEHLKKTSASNGMRFLSKETYEAIALTTQSTVSCVRYLLDNGFHYVLTRSFSSDPIELLFSSLRQMSGANDMLDCRAVIFTLHRMLNTGIMSAADTGNVGMDIITCNTASRKICTDKLALSEAEGQTVMPSLPVEAIAVLERLREIPATQRVTMKLASLSFIGGYLVKKVGDVLSCDSCMEHISTSKCYSPIMNVIGNQDRGGLHYPKTNFVYVLAIIQEFVEQATKTLNKCNVSETLCKILKAKLKLCPLFICDIDMAHSSQMLDIISGTFVPILLKNIANCVTEDQEKRKYLHSKSLSRKILKVH